MDDDINKKYFASEIAQIPPLFHTISSIIEGVRLGAGIAFTLASQVLYASYFGRRANQKTKAIVDLDKLHMFFD